jgi:Zn-dependent protease
LIAFEEPTVYQVTEVALTVILLVISLGIHEAAHGWVALKCGDTTARDLGRITLNPIVHIDPFLTILLPIIMKLTTGYVFGGAKPVPVNYYNLRHPLRDMALVALAGPLSNFLLAVFFFLCQKVLVDDLGVWRRGQLGPNVLEIVTISNLMLATFNLLPVPPLDGSRVMAWLLPSGMREAYARLESLGLVLVFLLVFGVPAVSRMVNQTVVVLYNGIDRFLGHLW